MRKNIAFLAFALAVAGCTSENDTSTQKNTAMNKMIESAAGSYSLIPHTITKDKEDRFTGNFDLIIKLSQFKNDNAFDKSGKQGTSLCSVFKVYSPSVDQSGKMAMRYQKWFSYGRTGSYDYRYSPLKDMEPATLLSIPDTLPVDNNLNYDLPSETKTVCQFTPK